MLYALCTFLFASQAQAAAPLLTYEMLQSAWKRNGGSEGLAKNHQNIKLKDKTWSEKPGTFSYTNLAFVNMSITQSQVDVGYNPTATNATASLVIANVSMAIPPTQFSAKPSGWWFPCDGVMSGFINSTAAAAQAAIEVADNATATAVGPSSVKIVNQVAQIAEQAVTDIKHTLDGLCGLVEDLLKELLGLVGQLVKVLVTEVLPKVTQMILNDLIKDALSMEETGIILTRISDTTVQAALPFPERLHTAAGEIDFLF